MKTVSIPANQIQIGDEISGLGIVSQIKKGDKKIEFMLGGKRFPKKFHPQAKISCVQFSQYPAAKGFALERLKLLEIQQQNKFNY